MNIFTIAKIRMIEMAVLPDVVDLVPGCTGVE
jgi:hypothetical protein